MSTVEATLPQEGAEVGGAEHTRGGPYYRPSVDIYELAAELVVLADVPGAKNNEIEIHFEDGHREVKKANDRGVRLLRRATGASEVDERHADRHSTRDREIDEVRRSDVRKR